MDNIKIYPVLVKWKKNKQGTCPLHVCVDINGKRAAFPSLKRRLSPDQWDETKREVKKNNPQYLILNALISKYIADLDTDLMKKSLLGGRVNKETVKRRVKTGSAKVNFLSFCREFIDGAGYAVNTKRVYLSELCKLQRYSTEILFSDLNYEWFSKYERYMRDKLENQPNTIWKSFKFLKTMLNEAVKRGIVDKSPLDSYGNIQYKQGIPDHMQWPEVLAFKKMLLENKAISELHKEVGYRYFLSCVSGLRFSDAVKFSYDKHVIGDNRILLSTAKTGEIVSIGFTEDIRIAVDYLKGKDGLKITNQGYNDILRQLGGIAGIKTKLKSHTARHTFAMRCAELGMSGDDVQRLLGHSSREHTKIYFKVTNTRLDNAMKVWDK